MIKNIQPVLLTLFVLFSTVTNVVLANNTTETLQAQPDHSSTQINRTITVSVLDNDKGENIIISSASSFSQERGRVVINLSKTKITYTPSDNFSGNDSFWYEITDKNGDKKTTFVTILVSSAIAQRDGALDFKLIPIHYQLLKAEPHTWEENGGLTPFELASNANEGDTTLTLTGNTNLHESELLVYVARSGIYHVIQVAAIQGNTVTLTEPLTESIAAGIHLWNFYDDASHPNTVGYIALADFSLNQLDTSLLVNKVHAFIGDSWLDDGVFESRIKNRINISQTINKAVGGRQSIHTLNTFDDDFPANTAAPDFFWIALGTNDYWKHTSAQDYTSNMKQLIEKINALGATAIVLNSSVGPDVYDESFGGLSSFHRDLSHKYANGMISLSDNQNSDSGDSDSGDSDSGDSDSGNTDSGNTDSGNTGSGSTGSGDAGSGSIAIPSRSGGGSMLWLELLLFAGLFARRKSFRLRLCA